MAPGAGDPWRARKEVEWSFGEAHGFRSARADVRNRGRCILHLLAFSAEEPLPGGGLRGPPAGRLVDRNERRVIFTDDTDREDFVVQRRCTVENRTVTRDRAAWAERDQFPGDYLVILGNPSRRVDENPNPESWNSEGLRVERCPVSS